MKDQLDFSAIRAKREKLVNLLLEWKEPNSGLYKSTPVKKSISSKEFNPSFTNSGIVLQALKESGRDIESRRLAENIVNYLDYNNLKAFSHERKPGVPHAVTNSWAAFSIIDSHPDLTPGIDTIFDWFSSSENYKNHKINISDLYWPFDETSEVQKKSVYVTAYVVSALMNFYEYYSRTGQTSRAERARNLIEGGVRFLRRVALEKSTRMDEGAPKVNILVWPKHADSDTGSSESEASFGTTSLCLHVLAKWVRMDKLDEKTKYKVISDSYTFIADKYCKNKGDNFWINKTRVLVWSSIQVGGGNEYYWYFHPPLTVVTAWRLYKDKLLENEEVLINFTKECVSWILSKEKGGIPISDSKTQVQTWSTALAVITLSRVLSDKEAILLAEERLSQRSSPQGQSSSKSGLLGQRINGDQINRAEEYISAISQVRAQPLDKDQTRAALSAPVLVVFIILWVVVNSIGYNPPSYINTIIPLSGLLMTLLAAYFAPLIHVPNPTRLLQVSRALKEIERNKEDRPPQLGSGGRS